MTPTYLLGGIWAGLEPLAHDLVERVGAAAPRVTFLAQDAAEWREYRDIHTEPFREVGFERIDAVAPADDGELDVAAAVATIRRADAIFVCGGDVWRYRRYFGEGRVAACIREIHAGGAPYAGLSAGAMLAASHIEASLAPTVEASDELRPGLGLVDDLLVAVHQTQRDSIDVLRASMARNGVGRGIGLDDRACVRLAGDERAVVSGEATFIGFD